MAKVMGDRRHRQKEIERQKEQEAEVTPFQKMIQERAKRMERIEQQQEAASGSADAAARLEGGGGGGESSEDSGHCSPEPKNEFMKVHAKLKRVQPPK